MLLRYILFCTIILLLTGCFNLRSNQQKYGLPNNWDGGLLSGQPCTPPCFSGIIPGDTTKSEALKFISDEQQFQDCSINDQPNRDRYILCKGVIIIIQQDSEIVEAVGFKVTQAITLGDVIAKYGEPTTVSVMPEGTHHSHIGMIVLFNDSGIRLDLNSQEGYVYHLNALAPVDNIVYYSSPNDDLPYMFLHRWNGYGEYP